MYNKPLILTNDDMAEGVYAASGGSRSASITGCWTGTATLNQKPELGQDCYTVHFDAHHESVSHLSPNTKIVVKFNQNITLGQQWYDVQSCTVNGDTITAYRYSGANPGEGFGSTGLYIKANDDIGIISVYMSETE